MRTNRGVLAGALLMGFLAAAPANAQTASRLGPSITAISAFVKGSAVAYDPKNSKYLVVSGYGDLNGRFVSADGALLGSPFTIQAGAVGFAHFPGVAYSPDANGGAGGFLVAWHQSVAVGAVVYARTVSTTGALGPATQLTASGSWWEAIVDVAYSTGSQEFFVVWQAAGIRAQRVSNTGGLLGANIFVTGTNYHRDPSVAYNPVANEFMVVYAGDDGVSPFVGARRVAAGSGALVGTQTLLSRAVGTYITDVAYNSSSNTYLAAWYQGGTYGRILDAAGTATTGVLLLATRFSAYDALGIDYNATSGTYMMVSHDTASLQDGAVELSAGAVPGLGFVATDAPTTKGNYYPKIAARAGKPEWLMSTATSFAATTVQRLQTGTVGTGGGGSALPAALTVTLTANKPSVVPEGTTITWTATGNGGTGPYQYQFFQYTQGPGWILAQPYSSVNTFTWVPNEGPHTVQVWVRNAGSSAPYDSYASSAVSITSAAARITSFTSNIALPPPPGQPVTWTAVAVAGSAVEYQFWRYSTTTGWIIAQPYSPVSVYTLYPSFGQNYVQVWVRRTGSTAAYEGWAGTASFTVGSSPAKVVSLTPSTLISQPGVPITWTAVGSGGSGDLQYKFFLRDETSGAWYLLRDWSTGNTATWVPSAGLYRIQVWVRSTGSGVAYEDWRNSLVFSITTSTSLTLTPNRSVTILRQGDVVTFTATIGAAGAWEYRFFIFNGNSWTVAAEYSTQNLFVWAATAGTRTIEVWARTVGSSAAYERFADLGPFVVSP